MKLNYDLETPFIPKNHQFPLQEYPRPQLKRESYMNLNGFYGFEINQTGKIPDIFSDCILVPYPVESMLSGVKRRITAKDYLIYSKEFECKKEFIKDISILHIDAIDQEADIYFNGEKIASHKGSYLPFIHEVCPKEGENRLDIVVRDTNSYLYPTGKQREKRGGIWYTPISGIWQSVWLESVFKDYIKDIKITPNIDLGIVDISFHTDASSTHIKVYDGEEIIFDAECKNKITVPIKSPKYWSPENPFLYTFTLTTEKDRVESYFAYRKFSMDSKHFLLNNKPYFINGLLDQGYFSDGIYTPRDYSAYLYDIRTMKSLGFNALRKHIKIEPMMYYYFCDREGILVLQDMVNLGKYSFFKDSVLPIAFKRKKLPYIHLTEEQKKNFICHSKEIVEYLYNVGSICYYTIFNEGWGQFDGDLLYDTLKEIDNTRIYDATSGWYWQNNSDVDSYHIYFKRLKIKEGSKPIIISEFGGYSYKDKDHSFNLSKTFGYKKFKAKEEFQEAFIKLYQNEVYPLKDKIIGVIYTQVSDCEDETNGLLTYDRRALKVDKDIVKPVLDILTRDN